MNSLLPLFDSEVIFDGHDVEFYFGLLVVEQPHGLQWHLDDGVVGGEQFELAFGVACVLQQVTVFERLFSLHFHLVYRAVVFECLLDPQQLN